MNMKKTLIGIAVAGAMVVPPAVAYKMQAAPKAAVEHVVKKEVKKAVEKNLKKGKPVKKVVKPAPQGAFPKWNP